MRKVARGKWDRCQGLGDDEISADAVTADMKTAGNTISFWRFDSADESNIHNAVLVMAANGDRADKYDIAWLDDGVVAAAGLALENSDGGTPVESLKNNHVDVVHLDAIRLGHLAGLIGNAIRAGQCKRLNQQRVLEVLATAIRGGLLRLEALKEKLASEVEAHMLKRHV